MLNYQRVIFKIFQNLPSVNMCFRNYIHPHEIHHEIPDDVWVKRHRLRRAQMVPVAVPEVPEPRYVAIEHVSFTVLIYS